MTKIQKGKHVDAIRKLLEQNGWELNRWGKYVKGAYKAHIKDNNLRITKKLEHSEPAVFSKAMTGLDLEDVEKLLKKYSEV